MILKLRTFSWLQQNTYSTPKARLPVVNAASEGAKLSDLEKRQFIAVQQELVNQTFKGRDWYERVANGEAGVLDFVTTLKYMSKLRLTNE